MTETAKRRALATRAIHGGQAPDPATGAIMAPIYATSTYVQASPGVNKGYAYGRGDNPTREAYQRCIADLEGGAAAFAFASGMGAIATLLELLDHGAHVIAGDDIYGGTYRLFERVRRRSAGLEVSFVDLGERAALEAALRPSTRLIWVETPTNPLLRLVDLDMVAEVARRRGILTAVDNTFATPCLQRPLEHGIDLVVHSATKYLNGHSDALNGVIVVGENGELRDQLKFLQGAVGAIPGPFDSFLVLRGLKTLPLRMERHCANAARIAAWLARHPRIDKVYYPGLADHPGHALAKRQMADFGGMISAVVGGGAAGARRLLERTELFALAESLGGVESLIGYPAVMTHAAIPAEVRERLGIGAGLVRLSVGIEDAQDLIDDLDQALA